MDETAKFEMTRGTVVFEMDTDPPKTARITCKALEKITNEDVRGEPAVAAYKAHADWIHRVAMDHPGFADGNVTLRAEDF